jgi:hypothetical protein
MDASELSDGKALSILVLVTEFLGQERVQAEKKL